MITLNILGLCGSLRAASLNRAVLTLAGELMPPGMQLDVAEIRSVPFFDADVLDQDGHPQPVVELRDRIRAADGVLIATPEYNFSTPGVLKNTLDWVSRGANQPFAFKPTAILSATPGPLGGARVQYDLRRVLLFMNAQVLAKPEVFIGGAAAKFANGTCTDDTTRRFVQEQMLAFQRWIGMVQRMAT